ncbi:MAG: zinc ribbon domain-containing protein [Chloroflexi bacterium]|nr:zinc ribbon domain-containing protein [Chloroflexota bacterium]
MHFCLGWLILLPFAGAFWLTIKVTDACIKIGGIMRLLGALLSLLVGGLSVFAGWQIGPIVGWFIMVCGGGLAIFGSWRVLTTTKEELELEELEEKLDKEMKRDEEHYKQRGGKSRDCTKDSICPNCGSQNASGYQFCGACGTSLASTCPRCGAIVDPSSRFCTNCGAMLV